MKLVIGMGMGIGNKYGGSRAFLLKNEPFCVYRQIKSTGRQ